MQPYYERDGIVIYHADSLDLLPSFEDRQFGAILTDPPYNAGVPYATYDDSRPAAEYEVWCGQWFAEARRVASQVVIFPGHGNMPLWWSVEPPRSIGCWHKPGSPGKASVFQFCEWEPFLVWGGGFALGSNVIRATVTKQADTGNHPCPKPVSLMSRLIGQLRPVSVLDPFMGSGTTLVAARNMGVPAIGIEIDEHYCEIAVRRLAQGVLFAA